jgi:hypothetical protein
MPHTLIKYVAELEHVREVSLLGVADLGYWRDRLTAEDLTPAEKDGQARVLITAADARFMGVPFREISFSVLVSQRGEGSSDEATSLPQAAYLAQAFNSCRFFAFCERAFFSTPYYYANVRLTASVPASIQLSQRGKPLFVAEMQAVATCAAEPRRVASQVGDDGWQGPVFLPSIGRKDRRRKLFYAQIRGHTQTYEFLPSGDRLAIQPAAGSEALQALVESQFMPTHWAIRESATHAKSKTYRRGEA